MSGKRSPNQPAEDQLAENGIKMIFTARKPYDRKRKPSITDLNIKRYDHRCALDHNAKFQKKSNEAIRAMKKLFFVSCICFLFMAAEFAGGIISGSLAVLTDAAHMFSDVAGFMISFFSILIA
jgi:hypothetical protein